jgi:hypothetical protein
VTLVRRLPDDCLTRTTPETRRRAAELDAWDTETELLAKLVDLASIMAARHVLTGEPPRVPRPDWLGRPAAGPHRGGQPGPASPDGYAQAINVLRASSKNTFVMPAAE